MKRQPHPPSAVFATLCDKDSSATILLQSTVPWILMNMTFANTIPIHNVMSLDEHDFFHMI
jgi:hypothetical protein